MFSSVTSGRKREMNCNESISGSDMRPARTKGSTKSVCDRAHTKSQGTKHVELGVIELQVPMGDILSPNPDESIDVWNRASNHTKRQDI